jgi:hypothetical protein
VAEGHRWSWGSQHVGRSLGKPGMCAGGEVTGAELRRWAGGERAVQHLQNNFLNADTVHNAGRERERKLPLQKYLVHPNSVGLPFLCGHVIEVYQFII